ncbi:hypothetical protein KAH43_06745 [Candidatus Bipolaricaulota bacterium]|nr:hypothetical protein [Candidatus Bipolaricaulota bacterium]
MRRYVSVLVLLVGLLLFSGYGVAQEDVPAGLVREDLQLISQESLSHWTPVWTGPIQAATVMAWFADHGYSRLMRDFNDDGVIDELDTIELANDFGLGIMEAESLRGTTDVRLVVGLANYVAGYYPGEFVLKIYDSSFSHEFTAQGFGAFESNAIPGIVLQLEGEPSVSAYIYEMATDEGVIIGIEEELDLNRYFAGRSYLIEKTPEGYTPLDFAWAKEDTWKTGHQGQVLQTVGRMDNRFYLEFMNKWKSVEFMLALSPLDDDEEEEGPPDDTNGGCPDLAIRILDESCVYDPRAKAYNITVWAEVLNIGTEPVTAPFLVVLNSTTHPGGAVQVIPVPPLFNPGDIIPITMSFSTPPDPSGAAPCPLTYVIIVDECEVIDECDEDNNTVWGEVCCGDDEGDCPDLIGEITRVYCTCDVTEEVVETYIIGYDRNKRPIYGERVVREASSTCDVHVTVVVSNIGSAAAGSSHALLTDHAHGISDSLYIDALGPAGSGTDSTTRWATFSFDLDAENCFIFESLDLELIVDSSGEIVECDEENSVWLAENCRCP